MSEKCPRCESELGTGITLVPVAVYSDEGTGSDGSGEFKQTVKCPECGYSRAEITKALPKSEMCNGEVNQVLHGLKYVTAGKLMIIRDGFGNTRIYKF